MDNLDRQYEAAIQKGDYDLGLQLAEQRATSQGFSTWAWHGTCSNFDEFKDGDIGFHFAKDKRCA
jgi:hypothetical protein